MHHFYKHLKTYQKKILVFSLIQTKNETMGLKTSFFLSEFETIYVPGDPKVRTNFKNELIQKTNKDKKMGFVPNRWKRRRVLYSNKKNFVGNQQMAL